MAWTAPATQTDTTLVTAALWNEQIAANMQFMGAAHDHNGGAGDGVTLTPIPSGMIILADAACPVGWTRVSAWDGKMIRSAAAYGGTGGSDTHTHTGFSHTHTVTAHTHAGVSHDHTAVTHTHAGYSHTHGGTHLHGTVTAGATSTGVMDNDNDPSVDAGVGTTGSAGNALPAANTAAADSGGNGATGAGTGTTGAGSTLPAYANIIFCKKN